MVEKYDYNGAVKGLVSKADANNFYADKPFAFVSYSHANEDVIQIYPFLKALFEAGYLVVLDTEYAEMNDSWVNGMTKRVYNENCKLMLSFTSKSYMYSRPSLIEQYCRYSSEARKSNNGEVIPCFIVDTAGEDVSYMKNVNQEMINRTQTKNPKERYTLRENSESAECLRNGLKGFYRTDIDNSMVQRIINREYEALQKYENIDEIRRQMLFVLKASEDFKDMAIISDDDALKQVKSCFEKCGITADNEIKEFAKNHFENWGIEYFDYIEDGKAIATMIYHPRKKTFELVSTFMIAEKDGFSSDDIVEFTQTALNTKEEITNPEEKWINREDHKSLRKKYGYFSDYELTPEQDKIHKKSIEKIEKYLGEGDIADGQMGHLIVIQGEAGTGKTVLAQRIFTDVLKKYPDLNCYFAVNHNELISQYKSELKKFGVPANKIDKPSIVLNNIDKVRGGGVKRPDIIFIDEAHLMNTRKSQVYTDKNKNFILADNMVSDMRRSAKIVFIMFDENQILKGEQCWNESLLESIIDESIENGDYAILKRQMRIEAEQEVVDWISTFVKKHRINPIPSEMEYKIQIFDTVTEMYEVIKAYASVEETRYSRMVATFDYRWSPTGSGENKLGPWFVSIEKEGWKLPWNNEHSTRKEYYENKYKLEEDKPWIEQDYSLNEVGSTFSVQGFDMPYVGVILGKSLTYNKDSKKVEVVPELCKDHSVMDAITLNDGEQSVKSTAHRERLIWNAVNILLTRGRKGLFIYAEDENLREALLNAYGKVNIAMLPNEYDDILTNKDMWRMYTRKSYEVKIQTAKVDKEYNVHGKPGIVFNKFEKVEADVTGYDYVVTGVSGEMWPIHESSLKGYNASPSEIKATPSVFTTKENDIVYYAFQIPTDKKFSVILSSGIELQGNVDGVEHGTGDYLVCTDFEAKDYRIVNGSIFDKMYLAKI